MITALIKLSETGKFSEVIDSLKKELSGINWLDDLDNIDLDEDVADYDLWPDGKKHDAEIHGLLMSAQEARAFPTDRYFTEVLKLKLQVMRDDRKAQTALDRLITKGSLTAEAELRAHQKGGDN